MQEMFQADFFEMQKLKKTFLMVVLVLIPRKLNGNCTRNKLVFLVVNKTRTNSSSVLMDKAKTESKSSSKQPGPDPAALSSSGVLQLSRCPQPPRAVGQSQLPELPDSHHCWIPQPSRGSPFPALLFWELRDSAME